MAEPTRVRERTATPSVYRRGSRYVARWKQRGRGRARSFTTEREAVAFLEARRGRGAPPARGDAGEAEVLLRRITAELGKLTPATVTGRTARHEALDALYTAEDAVKVLVAEGHGR